MAKKKSNVLKFPSTINNDNLGDDYHFDETPPTNHSGNKEHYRIGYDTVDKMATLTIMSEGGLSTTLHMNKSAAEQLIRMLRAAFPK